MNRLLTLIGAMAATPLFAAAEIDIRFIESAPKDRFTITHTGGCPIAGDITLDLTPSKGAVFFDVTASGKGVEVFQPLEIVSGRDLTTDIPAVKDGDQSITLSLNSFQKGDAVSFTIDVDDSLKVSQLGQIRVGESELAGAVVSIYTKNGKSSGVFNDNAQASVVHGGCLKTKS